MQPPLLSAAVSRAVPALRLQLRPMQHAAATASWPLLKSPSRCLRYHSKRHDRRATSPAAAAAASSTTTTSSGNSSRDSDGASPGVSVEGVDRSSVGGLRVVQEERAEAQQSTQQADLEDAEATSWLPFKEARRYVRALGLKSEVEWRAWSRSDIRPSHIPSNPNLVYAKSGWRGYRDWLGRQSVITEALSYL